MSSGPSPRVIGPEEGEMLLLRPPTRSGAVTIKVDPRSCGARAFSMGTQRIESGAGIPVHRHEAQEEILLIQWGTAIAVIGEERVAAGRGTTVYIPAGAWHGVENPGPEPLEVVWIISPPGLEEMFRAIGSPPDVQPEPLSASEFAAIAAQHGMQVHSAAEAYRSHHRSQSSARRSLYPPDHGAGSVPDHSQTQRRSTR